MHRFFMRSIFLYLAICKQMKYMTIKEAAEKWKIGSRAITMHCNAGRIAGAHKRGNLWLIPTTAEKPLDRRFKEAPKAEAVRVADAPLPRQCPFLIMSDIYATPGSAESVAETLEPQAAMLFRAQLAYYRGEIDKVYASSRFLLEQRGGYNMQIGAGMLLSLCAMYRGDVALWKEARTHIEAAPCCDAQARQQLAFWLAGTDSAIHDISNFPEWFRHGTFDPLPKDAFALARFFYVKYLYILCYEAGAIRGAHKEGVYLARFLPAVTGPLVSQSAVEGNLLVEIYLRLLCAIMWHDCGNDAQAITHLDRAIQLALPDKLYSPLAEYRKPLDFLMEERLREICPEAVQKVRTLNRQLLGGWVKLHNAVLNRTVSNELTIREREVAKLASFGLSNKEIAEWLHITLGSVKQTIQLALDKTGAQNRRSLGKFI